MLKKADAAIGAKVANIIKVAKTRFASRYTLLRHLLNCREQLITTVWLSKWKHLEKNPDDAIGVKVAGIIKKDEFWDEKEKTV